jgi:hypothetical protein
MFCDVKNYENENGIYQKKILRRVESNKKCNSKNYLRLQKITIKKIKIKFNKEKKLNRNKIKRRDLFYALTD